MDTVPLSQWPAGQTAQVDRLQPPPACQDWAPLLAQLGFEPGEPVQLLRRAPLGDPLVVRIGQSTFALRAAEAACVRVRAWGAPAMHATPATPSSPTTPAAQR